MLLRNILPLVALTHAASVVISVYPQQTTPSPAVVIVTRTRAATTSAPASSSTSSSATLTGQTTAITGCHFHESVQYCLDGNGVEGSVIGATGTTGPESYTSCHAHDAAETYCVDESGAEVQFVAEATTATNETTTEDADTGVSCHFHAGVEHCVGGSAEAVTCERVDRDYNIPLRIGLLFVILTTSALAAFGPMVLNKLLNLSFESILFIIIKQFGTGIIISTAFVHLITHALLMWGNECMGELSYEATGTSITMAGIFLAFLVEFLVKRLMCWRLSASTPTDSQEDLKDVELGAHDHSHGLLLPNDPISVITMEAGIIFHSILIGITLVVSGDSFFITLFVVILFHQVFEGLALGSRIAQLEETPFLKKCLMAGVYALVTPVGMAIGIGVLSKFNGNDKSTLIALGTLDSFSAGVLIWTGVVEMWANDWLFGSLSKSGVLKTCIGMGSLMAGMILMSVLGKWA